MTNNDIFTYTAMAASVIIGAVVLWPHIWPKDSEPDSRPVIHTPAKPKAAQTPKPKPKPIKPAVNPETLKAMHKQADAERAIAEALERKMLRTTDPVKHARLEKQAANSWLRFNKTLDQIDKITMQ